MYIFVRGVKLILLTLEFRLVKLLELTAAGFMLLLELLTGKY